MRLGERIERRRKEIGISQAELARRVGVRQSTMNSLINGDSRTSRSLLKIARELRTTAAFLTGETDDPEGGFEESPLTSDERELLDLFRELDVKERGALVTLARSIATSVRSSTVHAPVSGYRAGAPETNLRPAPTPQAVERALAEAMKGPLPRRPEARARYLATVVQQLLSLPEDPAANTDSAAIPEKAAGHADDPAPRATRRA